MRNGVFAKEKVGAAKLTAGPAQILDLIHGKRMAGYNNSGNPHFQRGMI
jgi:hypothetical protein